MYWRAAVFLAIVLPALTVSWGRVDSQVVFVLYREPKLAASWFALATILGVLAWRDPRLFEIGELRKAFRQPIIATLAGLLTWLAITGLWATVPQLFIYEAVQYAGLSGLLLLLVTAHGRSSWKGLDQVVESAVICAGGVVTAVGLAQLSGGFPILESWLAPIDPQFGAPHPSLMGYKNPAAHAVAGQLFLVLGRATTTHTLAVRLAWLGVAALEILYLSRLNSRASYLAVAVGLVFVVNAWPLYRDHRRLSAKTIGAMLMVAALATVFLISVTSSDRSNERLLSIASYLSVDGFGQTDRGTYLLNTIEMVKAHPLGVGLGQWQAHYPVFRRHNRFEWFDHTFQVRRAHGDHVQLFGEAGWPGLGLWLGVLACLLWAPLAAYRRHGHWRCLFLFGQIACCITAMAGDYVIEMPFHKWQLFLLIFLVIAASRMSEEAEEIPPSLERSHWPVRGAMATIALFLVVLGAQHLRQQQVSAELQRRYTLAIRSLADDGRVRADQLEYVLILGQRLDKGWSLGKTFHRDHLARGHAALLLDRRSEAESHARRALALHPYSPKTLAFMARAVPPEQAEAWAQATDWVMNEAVAGWPPPDPIAAGLRESN